MDEQDRQNDADRTLWRRAVPSPGAGASPCPDELELAAWLDGRADADLAGRIESHLAECTDCLRAAEELRATLAAGPMMPPPQVVERAKRLGRGRWRRPAVLWLRAGRWAAVAAAAVLVGYAGFTAGAATREKRQAAEAAVVREATFGLTNGSGEELGDLLALTEVQP
jgi:anti-sigma factor RsiW